MVLSRAQWVKGLCHSQYIENIEIESSAVFGKKNQYSRYMSSVEIVGFAFNIFQSIILSILKILRTYRLWSNHHEIIAVKEKCTGLISQQTHKPDEMPSWIWSSRHLNVVETSIFSGARRHNYHRLMEYWERLAWNSLNFEGRLRLSNNIIHVNRL